MGHDRFLNRERRQTLAHCAIPAVEDAPVLFLHGDAGFDRVRTHIFVAGGTYLESDMVFGVTGTAATIP